MPITFSHPAAVVPLLGVGLVPSALVIGSITPDLPYYLPGPLTSARTHAASGIVTFDLVLGLLAFLVWHVLLAPTAVALAQRGAAGAARAQVAHTVKDFSVVLVLVSLGSARPRTSCGTPSRTPGAGGRTGSPGSARSTVRSWATRGCSTGAARSASWCWRWRSGAGGCARRARRGAARAGVGPASGAGVLVLVVVSGVIGAAAGLLTADDNLFAALFRMLTWGCGAAGAAWLAFAIVTRAKLTAS